MTGIAVNTDFTAEAVRLETLEQELKSIAEAGFTHIHWCNEWDGDYIYSKFEMKQIREMMDKYHLKAKSLHATKGSRRNVNIVNGHYRKDYTSDWEYNRKAGVELIQNRVDMAECLGASDIVLHLYMPHVTVRKHPEVKKVFYTQLEKSLNELEPYCMEKGIRICFENLFDMPGDCILEQWDWLMENYPKEFVGFCFDSGHANMNWGAGLSDVIRKYGERIFAVHLHDNYGTADFHMLPGYGNIDWEDVMEALADSAYQLPLNFELVCDRDDANEFLREAYKIGERLNKMIERYSRKQEQ